MIKFNTKSWHYRMHRFGANHFMDDTMNFCPYARGVLRGLLLFSLVWTAALALVIWNCMGLIFLSQGIWVYNDSLASVVNVFTAVTMAGVGIMAVFSYSQDRYHDWSRKKQRAQRAQGSEPGPRKPDSFVVEWFKNLHSKVCPTIEFTDS